jgi:hypothetical protein
MALDVVSKSRHDGGEYILPVLDLYRQYCQAHAKLDADGLRSAGVMFEQQEHLLLKGG